MWSSKLELLSMIMDVQNASGVAGWRNAWKRWNFNRLGARVSDSVDVFWSYEMSSSIKDTRCWMEQLV